MGLAGVTNVDRGRKKAKKISSVSCLATPLSAGPCCPLFGSHTPLVCTPRRDGPPTGDDIQFHKVVVSRSPFQDRWEMLSPW